MASYATVAEAAAGSASDAADSASDAEAYGAGTRGGSAVESGDEAYHNNAKYYAESAADDASTVASAVNSFMNITVPAAVQSVTDEGTTQIGLVQGEGTTQIGLVAGEGTTQVGAVEAKGAEVLGSIPEDYTALSDDVTDLKSAFDYISETGNITVSHNLTWRNGYVGATGVINSSSLSGYAIVPLEAGETVRIGTKNTNIAIISTTTESSLSVGDTVTPVKITTNVDTFQTYEYTAASPINVVLCVRLSNYEVSFFKKTNLVTKSEISNIIGLEKSIVYGGPLFSGTVVAATGEFAATGAWSCTDYFQIPFVSGSKMAVTGTIYPGSD